MNNTAVPQIAQMKWIVMFILKNVTFIPDLDSQTSSQRRVLVSLTK